jgi:uncharacterized protein YjiS (DUF1127 family)
MSATLSSIFRPAVTYRPGAISRLFGACLDGIARRFVRRAAIACLHELDDRELRDIGIVRSQIEAAVCGFMTAPESDEVTASSAALRAAIGSRAESCRRAASLMGAAPWN